MALGTVPPPTQQAPSSLNSPAFAGTPSTGGLTQQNSQASGDTFVKGPGNIVPNGRYLDLTTQVQDVGKNILEQALQTLQNGGTPSNGLTPQAAGEISSAFVDTQLGGSQEIRTASGGPTGAINSGTGDFFNQQVSERNKSSNVGSLLAISQLNQFNQLLISAPQKTIESIAQKNPNSPIASNIDFLTRNIGKVQEFVSIAIKQVSESIKGFNENAKGIGAELSKGVTEIKLPGEK